MYMLCADESDFNPDGNRLVGVGAFVDIFRCLNTLFCRVLKKDSHKQQREAQTTDKYLYGISL